MYGNMVKKMFGAKLRTLFFRYFWLFIIALFVFAFTRLSVLLIFILVNTVSQLYRVYIRFPLGIETLTFSTVVISFWLNPFIAWIVAMISVIASSFFTINIAPRVFIIRVMKHTITSIICAFMLGANIVTVGKVAVITVNVLMILRSYIMLNFFGTKNLLGNFMNIYLNFYLFDNFATDLLDLLG